MMFEQRRRRGFNPMIAVGMASIIVMFAGLSKATEVLGAVAVPIWLAAIVGGVVLLRGKLGDVLLEGMANHDQERELHTDPQVLQELDDLRAQVGELQERVDFTERLLARERDAKSLNAGA